MRSVLGVLIAATFAAGLAVVVDDARQREPQVDIEERIEVVLPPGQAEVTGTLTLLVAQKANVPALPVPLRFEASGDAAGATIDGAIVDGRRSTVVWDGGRPLELAGQGSLDLGPTLVELRPDGITWPLDGASRHLTPGSYTIDSPVAVGSAGLASPQDGVTFEADDQTTITTRGGIVVRTNPGPIRLQGPGELHAEGNLTVRSAQGTTPASVLDFGPGPYDLELVPGAGGWTVQATIRGPRHVR